MCKGINFMSRIVANMVGVFQPIFAWMGGCLNKMFLGTGNTCTERGDEPIFNDLHIRL
ncbi:unnamed protein product [Callosobruchus maculatus]|uniref:Uncharacterized protein n=1 Tax=Callosobruchus maculatus TaxID=64391 RepID=A0A653CNS4_CALMS|nr:unnamed protein product [Callosobruchus maculatus]